MLSGHEVGEKRADACETEMKFGRGNFFSFSLFRAREFQLRSGEISFLISFPSSCDNFLRILRRLSLEIIE